MDNSENKTRIYLPILLAVVLSMGFLAGIYLAPGSMKNSRVLEIGKYDKWNDIINYINMEYVDTVNKNELIENSINSILHNLDPHSYYIPAKDFQETNDQLLGSFEGIGIEFRIEKDTIIVVQAIAGGPSEKVGVRAGDRIVKIDGQDVASTKIATTEVMRKLKGKRGTKVAIAVYRRGISGLLDFVITRDIIPTYSIDVAYMVDNTIGYIKVNKFSATTYEEFYDALSDLKDKGMEQLILDLRGNAGGLMEAAIRISDEFLNDKKLIVFAEGRSRPRKEYWATKRGLFEKGELIVLIDEWSASASEIVAGAIQDNDRGIIIGRRSFGKGLVQEQLDFPDGSALRLTVARYFTPTGRCIQSPYKDGIEQYYSDFYDRIVNADEQANDSLHQKQYTTPGGKIVYGGGGITPDITVRYDTSETSKYFNDLIQRGLIYQFAFEYTDKNREKLKKYKSFSSFNRKFAITPELFAEFLSYAQKNGVSEDDTGIQISGNNIKVRLKAFIARNLFNDKGFYPIIHAIDRPFQVAVKTLREPQKAG